MEESISLLEQLRGAFSLKDVEISAYSPLTLAFIGDGIYDVIIRTVVVERGNRPANELHRETVKFVKAETQAALAESVLELLTPQELAIYKRGRNAKSASSAKNASVQEYRKATGFEALLGYLYLTDRTDRVIELVKCGLDRQKLVL